MALLGLLVEEVAGAAYAEVVRERVLEPAGMASSGFLSLDEVRPLVATGYLPPEDPGGLWHSNVFSLPAVGGPDGGLYATAGDLAAFLTAYDDGTLLPPAARDLLLTPYWPQAPGVSTGYAAYLYDWTAHRRERRFGHGGSDPGVDVSVTRLPELDANVVVLLNVPGPTRAIRDALVAEVLR